ncbi:unnamed protein product [Heterobilharzia americana]|nr:unnamed protein product [Heterobilharzia americana]
MSMPDGVNSCYRRRLPALLSSSKLLLNLCKALRQCLRVTENLTFLEFHNIPLNKTNLVQICEGIAKNRTLKHLSFEGSSVNDDGLADICRVLRNVPNISTFNLTACNLSKQGISALTVLLSFQAMQRHNAAWQESLRYRYPELDRLGGLKRITLNDNPNIGNEGAVLLADALIDDLWVKAIDLQACNLGDTAASTWLAVLIGLRVVSGDISFSKGNTPLQRNGSTVDVQHRGNFSLVVLDLRRNPNISCDLLRAVTERALINSEGKQSEFSWLKAGPQAPSQLCSGVVTYPWPGINGVTNVSGIYQIDRGPSMKADCKINKRSMSKEKYMNSGYTNVHSYSRDNLCDRPPFIPAGGRLRCSSVGLINSFDSKTHHKYNLDLGKKYARYSHCQDSGPASERAVWKSPGVSKIHKWPCGKPTTSLSARADCTGIPWRTAARASRCHGHPNYRCPGKTCLESRALHLDYDLVLKYATNKSALNVKKNDGKSVIYPPTRILNASNIDGCFCQQQQGFQYSQLSSKKKSQMKTSSATNSSRSSNLTVQQKLKQLMMKVSQLEKDLQAEKCKSGLLMKIQKDNGHNLFKIDSNSLHELRGFIYRLTSLIENLQHSKKNSNTKTEDIHILQDTFEDLCSLVSRITEENCHFQENPINQLDNDSMVGAFNKNNLTTYCDKVNSSINNELGENKLKNVRKCMDYSTGNKSNKQSCTDKQVKSHIHWKTYAKTRAVQTESSNDLIDGNANITDCMKRNQYDQTFHPHIAWITTNTTKAITTPTNVTAHSVAILVSESNDPAEKDLFPLTISGDPSQLTNTSMNSNNNDLWVMNYESNDDTNNNYNDNNADDIHCVHCFNVNKNDNIPISTSSSQMINNFKICKKRSQTEQVYAQLKAATIISTSSYAQNPSEGEETGIKKLQDTKSEIAMNNLWHLNARSMFNEADNSTSIPINQQNSHNEESIVSEENNENYTKTISNQQLNNWDEFNIEQNPLNNLTLNNENILLLNDTNSDCNKNSNISHRRNAHLDVGSHGNNNDDINNNNNNDNASDDELFDELIMANYCPSVGKPTDFNENSNDYDEIAFDNYSRTNSSLHMEGGSNQFYRSANDSLIS